MTQCRQQIEELEFHVRNTSSQQLNPSGILYLIVVQDVLRNQYNAFLSIASKVATCHEKVEKCKKPFEEFERAQGIKPSTSSSQHNYSEMASLLVPSSGHMSGGGIQAAGQFAPNSSAFGAPPSSSFGTLTNSTFGTSAFNKLPANNLTGSQTTSAPIFGANPTTNITQTPCIFGSTSAPTGTASTGSVNTPFNSFGNFGGLSVKRTSST